MAAPEFLRDFSQSRHQIIRNKRTVAMGTALFGINLVLVKGVAARKLSVEPPGGKLTAIWKSSGGELLFK